MIFIIFGNQIFGSTYDVTHKKNAPPKQNFFLVQSARLADLFEPLNSSLAQSAEELGRW